MRSCVCLALILALVMVAFGRGRECRGAAVPETAYARSLGTPSLLLDQPALVFALPQALPTWSSRAMGLGLLGNQDANSAGWGVLLGSRHSFSLLVDDGPDMGAMLRLDRAVQVGWGSNQGGARFGLSAGLGRNDHDSTSNVSQPSVQSEATQHVETLGYFGNLGLGYELRHAFVDLALQLAYAKAEGNRRQESSTTTTTTFWEQKSKRELSVTPSLTGRVGWDFGRDARLRVVGAWREIDVENTDSYRNESPATSIDQSAEGGITGELWELGGSASTVRDDVGRATLFAYYQRRTEPLLRTLSSNALQTVSQKTETTTLGFSLERDLVSRLRVLAGFRTALVDLSRETRYEDSDNVVIRLDTDESTSVTDRFSWGLLYEHRQLQLVGALDSRLDLQDLVLTLDASFLF